ncbi:FAD-dependent monooxygenase [Phanerochaete sordida]|uniref:FAD-dependent monooxygenase n=1 Tax=Phanerochaete sordida TaxID=48140 RepID=A0A9P3G0D2_9APHY|nr:FAD-dependent monooxygenase [Phanerochaete sordida]
MPSGESSTVERTSFPINFTIVGGGLSGLACAIALRQAGHDVVVLERDEHISPGGPRGGCRLTPNMTKVLRQWGLLEEVHKRCSSIMNTVKFYKCEGDEFLGQHEYTDEVLKECGGGYWIFLSHEDLRAILYDAAVKAGAEIRTGCIVSSIEPETRTVTLASGETLTAGVIVGADGATGLVRKVVAGRELTRTPDGYVLFHTSLKAEHIPEVPEIRGGNVDDKAVFVRYADGFCVYSYPVNPDGDLAIHIYAPDDGEDGDWNGQPTVNVAGLVSGQAPWLDKLATLVPRAIRVRNFAHEDLDDWVHEASGHVVVVGDAAHPFPQGGLQTFGMLIEDAAVLGKVFSYLTEESQVANTLWGFQDVRQTRCRAVHKREVHRARLFTLKNGPEQEARDEALRSRKLEQWHGSDLGLYSLEEPRVLFAYDANEAGAEWWQTWGILRERARREKPVDKPVMVGVEVSIEANVS